MIGGLTVFLFGAGVMLSRYYEGPTQGRTAGWRELAVALAQLSAGGPAERTRLIQNYPDPALWYYYRGPVPHLVLPPAPHDTQRTEAEVARMLDAGIGRVVLVVDERPTWDNDRLASYIVGQQYPLVAEQSVGHWPVQIYDRPSATWASVGASCRTGGRVGELRHQRAAGRPAGPPSPDRGRLRSNQTGCAASADRKWRRPPGTRHCRCRETGSRTLDLRSRAL